MRYYALLIQAGGCDHTIACGKELVRLASVSYPEAIIELRSLVIEEYPQETERELFSASLIETTNEWNMPVRDWYREDEQTLLAEKLRLKDEQEKQEYLRLKKKFEPEKE